MIHQLKIQKEYLRNIVLETKKAEVRLNDRDYQVGDILDFTASAELYGYDMKRSYYYIITHIHSGLGLEKGYVLLSIENSESKSIK